MAFRPEDGTTGTKFGSASPGPVQVKEFHFYDDTDQAEASHHHSIGLGPTQAASFPLVRSEGDKRWSPVGHAHPLTDGDELFNNGDFSGGSAGWQDSFWNSNASWAISNGELVCSITADNGAGWAGQAADPCVPGEALILTYEVYAQYGNMRIQAYVMTCNSTDYETPDFFQPTTTRYDIIDEYIVPLEDAGKWVTRQVEYQIPATTPNNKLTDRVRVSFNLGQYNAQTTFPQVIKLNYASFLRPRQPYVDLATAQNVYGSKSFKEKTFLVDASADSLFSSILNTDSLQALTASVDEVSGQAAVFSELEGTALLYKDGEEVRSEAEYGYYDGSGTALSSVTSGEANGCRFIVPTDMILEVFTEIDFAKSVASDVFLLRIDKNVNQGGWTTVVQGAIPLSADTHKGITGVVKVSAFDDVAIRAYVTRSSGSGNISTAASGSNNRLWVVATPVKGASLPWSAVGTGSTPSAPVGWTLRTLTLTPTWWANYDSTNAKTSETVNPKHGYWSPTYGDQFCVIRYAGLSGLLGTTRKLKVAKFTIKGDNWGDRTRPIGTIYIGSHQLTDSSAPASYDPVANGFIQQYIGSFSSVLKTHFLPTDMGNNFLSGYSKGILLGPARTDSRLGAGSFVSNAVDASSCVLELVYYSK